MSTEGKIILGIDPGYGRCGYAIIQEVGRNWKALAYGVITTAKDDAFEERLVEIGDDISHLIEIHQPDLLAIEELFFKQNVTTGLLVAEARGMIQYLCAKKRMPIVSIKPNEVKMGLVGYGKADKQQIQEMVKQVFGFDKLPKPDDAADALAVAWTGATRQGW